MDRVARTTMSWFSDISFLRPFWVLAVPAIIALAVLSMRRGSALGDWNAHIDPHLMDALRALGKIETSNARRIRHLPFWTAGGICLALTGPALERGNGQTFRNLDGVIFVVDVSASMTNDSLWPRALINMQASLTQLGTKPAAVIVFGGDSYLASALTVDHAQLSQMLALIDDKTVPDKGSRPGLALQQAADVLEQTQLLAADVVLVSDGDGFSAQTMREAAQITRFGARLSVLRVATSASEQTAVEQAVFSELAEQGGGHVYDVDDFDRLGDALSETVEKRLVGQDFQLLFWSDYGRYLLLLALLPAAALFRRDQA